MAMTACRAKLVTSSICLSGERTDFLAVNADDADQLIVLEHRDAENGAITAERDGSDHKWIALDVSLRSRNVGDLGDLLRVCRAPKAGIRARMDDRRACLGKCGRRVVHRHGSEAIALVEIECPELALAGPYGVVQHGREYRRQLARRTRDHLQHLGRRRLLLQRLGKLARARRDLVVKPFTPQAGTDAGPQQSRIERLG